MHKRIVFTPNAPQPKGPYSQGVVVGNTVYVAGQGGFDPSSGKLMNSSFEEEVTRTFENVKAIVTASGATMDDVVKVNVYLTDLKNFSRMNEIYKKYFTSDFPARATVGSALLLGTQIEIDCVAVMENK